jgi:SAM-dependent methyltransferase
MTTTRAHLTIDAWERAARADTFAAAIHPSGATATGVDDPAWRESGELHAAQWLDGWTCYGDGELPNRVLDFGAGAGRVAFPLATSMPGSEVIAADASPTMLRRLTDRCPPPNVGVCLSDGFDGRLPAVDAVHSIIVLQHHLWEDGAELLRRLIAAVRLMGLVGVQLPLYSIEGQSTDWTGVTTWTFRRFDQAVTEGGGQVLEAHVSPSVFRPGAIGPHHGAYHWIRRSSF